MPDPTPTRIGPYAISREIGRGGMGVVYLARDERLERDVAIKCLPEELAQDPDRLARFEREAKTLASLNHPNIASIYGLEEIDGKRFLILEYVDGETLVEYLNRHRHSWRKCISAAADIAEGLAAAHAKGVIHRDIKPDNVKFTTDGVVKLLDFGIAQPVRTDQPDDENATVRIVTAPGVVMGTPGYMSPEQIRGEPADPRSDIFAFGCLLHEMVTGRPTFARGTVADSMAATLQEQPPPPTLTGANTPGELDPVLMRCLEKHPQDRFQSARDLAFMLRGLLTTSEPIQASPPPPAECPSIAVLPFANLSADPENEYFSNGITDEIISALARVNGLRVPGRTSTFSFKDRQADIREIGRQLQVESILEGSVRRSGRRVRITAQLVSVADGYQLWSERFDRELDDVFEVQDEIARSIVQRLEVSRSGSLDSRLIESATDNVQAYEEYLRGRFAYEQRGKRLLAAARHLERAIELDSEFAVAYAALAETLALGGFYGLVQPHDIMPRAKEAAQRALAINPHLAEAHTALGHVHLLYDWDWNASELAYDRALALKPTYSQALIGKGVYLLGFVRGEFDEGLRLARAAVEHDPLNPTTVSSLGAILLSAGAFQEVDEMLEQAVRAHPQSFMVHRTRGACAVELKRWEEAAESFETSLSLSRRHCWPLMDLIEVRFRQGQTDRAASLYEEMKQRSQYEYVPMHMLSIYPALIGQYDESIELLERAVENRDGSLVALTRWRGCARALEALGDDPRVDRVVAQIGLSGDRRSEEASSS